jgi:hypothetical protein
MRLIWQLEQARTQARASSDPTIMTKSRELTKIEHQLNAMKSAWPPYDQFQRVGHVLFALLAGLVGGMVAAWFYTRRARAEAAASPAGQIP